MKSNYYIFYLSLIVSASGYSCDLDGLFSALTDGGSIFLDCTVPTTITIASGTWRFRQSFDFDGKNLVTLDGAAADTIFHSPSATFRNIGIINPLFRFTTNGAIYDSYIEVSGQYSRTYVLF